MGLDADLVRDAQTAWARLLESQHAAELAKADYHHAIRRLHASGGSLREIADVLHLSHQRVHQIIDEPTEPTRPWWRRRTRPGVGVGPCSFCGRSREECTQLIAGPGLYICDDCVRQATALAAGTAAEDYPVAAMTLEPSRSKAHCGFCGKQARKVQHLVAGESAAAPGSKFGQGPRICNECLGLCEEILAESTTPGSRTRGRRRNRR
jgi:ClpX C4-type zinc finger